MSIKLLRLIVFWFSLCSVQRDAHCGLGVTADFGFEELLRYSFWLEGSFSSSFNMSTIEECRGFCLKHNCTSLYFMDYVDKKTCTLYEGDRYHPTRRSAWVITGFKLNYASHRLCFKGKSCFLYHFSSSLGKRIFKFAQNIYKRRF